MINHISTVDFKNKFLLLNGDSKKVLKTLPNEIIHTVVTSPPYWQLRDYFVADQLGQEATPEEYVKNLVDIFKEIKRVLRKDGTVWLNIGDGYNNTSGQSRAKEGRKRKAREGGSADKKSFKHSTIKVKDLIGMPWRVAFSLQEDGWYLRNDIIYNKTNPMPDGAKDRPTRGHEYIFLLSKSQKYFYDYYAVLEDTNEHPDKEQGFGAKEQQGTFRQDQERVFTHYGKRNKRSVWTTSVASFKGKHFATFSTKLIDPCIKASTSERGCCVKCGTPWERVFDKEEREVNKPSPKKYQTDNDDQSNIFVTEMPYKKTYQLYLVEKGWEKKCECDTDETKPCLVLDPFSGTGTTGVVSFKYDQYYVGIELNKEYLDISRDRLVGDHIMNIQEVSSIEELINARDSD